MNKTKCLIATAIAAISLTACSPRPLHFSPPCRVVAADTDHETAATLATLKDADFIPGTPGEWVAENGDGAIIGYAAEEDSTVYATAWCALASRNPQAIA